MLEAHFDVYGVHKLEMALEHAYIYKKIPGSDITFSGLHTVPEFWEWMDRVFIPSSFSAQIDPVGKPTERHTWGRVQWKAQLRRDSALMLFAM